MIENDKLFPNYGLLKARNNCEKPDAIVNKLEIKNETKKMRQKNETKK